MTTTVPHSLRPSAVARTRWAVADTVTVTKRNLIRYVRIPEALFFSSVQPIMFVLLFRYVFGGAIPVAGGSYVNYLMPGIFVQTVIFGAASTALGLAEDLQSGLLERFRALPMAHSAVLSGRTLTDLIRNGVVIVVMTTVGLAVGFRPMPNAVNYFVACVVIMLFAFSLMWLFAIVGLSAPTAETAQLMTFPIIFPLTFASTAFVPAASMPGWLQGFAKNQPVSQAVDAARSLMVGGPYHDAQAVWASLAWSAGLLVLFVPLAVRKYRKAT